MSGLGLIMQLVGGVMTAIVATAGLMFLIGLMQGGGRGGPPGTLMLFMFAALATSILRSVAHTNAGRRLLYDGPGSPHSALSRYLMIAWIHTAVVAGGLLVNDVPANMVFGLALLFAAWPLALTIIAKPKVAEFGDAVPMADDKGFDGAAILLLIFGAIGVGIGAILVLSWLSMPAKGELITMALFVAYVMMLIRSILHLRAGVRGISATHMAETSDAAQKYAGFGVIAAVVSGGVLLVGFIAATSGRGMGGGGMAMLVMMMMVTMLTWVLLIWPNAVRRFFSERHFETVMDERSRGLQQSTDRGLPALGWLLLAFGAFALAQSIFGLLMGDMGGERGMRRGMRDNPMMMLMGTMGSGGTASKMMGLGVAATQLWAAVELIRLSPRFKLAGTVFGVVASGVALYLYLPIVGALMDGGGMMVRNPALLIMFPMVAMSLVIPVATLIFVQRKIRDPKALAQTFE